tara:strand:- start:6362 stop:6709 length:348 start_codon:yes stop_codon:yes gene_type:complete
MVAWYDPKINGTIEEYIEFCKSNQMGISFKGPEQFQQLVNLGYITPHITSIRLMYGMGSAGFYQVIDNFQLEGVDVSVHAGKEGIHNPKELLSGDVPHFEVSMMNPHPTPLEDRE